MWPWTASRKTKRSKSKKSRSRKHGGARKTTRRLHKSRRTHRPRKVGGSQNPFLF